MLEVNVSRGRWEPVEDIVHASKAVRAHIEANGLGSSEWTGTGKIRNARGSSMRLHVSYNGRVWMGETAIYSPTERT